MTQQWKRHSHSAGPKGPAGPASSRGPVSYLSLGLTMATGAGILWWYQQEKTRKLEAISGKAVVVGQAAIGGPFALIDSKGKPFTHEDLKGRFSLLYFGFTHCPDICPEELEKLASALDIVDGSNKMGKNGIVPVFISVDPERDGPAQVGAYVSEFHPRMIGLTGTVESVKSAARAYRVYYTKASVGGDSTSDDDYLIDHSIITYLLDPEGNFVTFYGRNYTAEEIAANISKHLENWKVQHPEWQSNS